MSLLAHLRLRRVQLWLLLLTGLSLGLCFVPLLGLLGYEFSLILALAGSLAGAHLGSVAVATARGSDAGMAIALRPPPSALLLLLGRTLLYNLALLAPPLALISLNALRVRNCDYLEGLLLYALMPGLSVAIASTAGSLWALALPRPALATTAALLTVIGSLAWGVHRFYAAPPIFGYDPFVGYFPGSLYDEDLAVRPAFYFYRLHNLFWLTGLVLLAARRFDPATLRLSWSRRRHAPQAGRKLLLAAGLALLAGGGLYSLGPTLGFRHDAASIRSRLGGVRRSAHFDIYYPEEMKRDEVELLVEDHEHRHAQLVARLGVTPPRIGSYIFRSTEEKRALMGAARTLIAKPWLREVYLQDQGFPHPVLRHELAHVFGASFGDSLFGLSRRWRWSPLPHPVFNVGLIEGLAVAADWRPYGELDGHQMAAALTRLGLAPPLASLFGYGFLAQAASRSYILAGSFCRYLLERYGAWRLRQVYRSGGDFAAAYGRPLAALLDEWSRWLATVSVPPAGLQLAREIFRRPSILGRVCGHEVANLLAEADRLRAEDKPAAAARLLERVCRFDPGDPGHLLERMHDLVAARQEAAALALAPLLQTHPALSPPLRRRALELVGDVRWRAGALAPAREAYRKADSPAATPAERRLLWLKRWALTQPEPVRLTARDYLVPAPDRPRAGALEVHLAHALAEHLPRSGIGPYLAGKQLAAREHCPAAITPLEQALARELPTGDLGVEARQTLGRCLYRTGALDRAARIFRELAAPENTPAGLRLEAEDWLDRISWRARHP